MEAYEVINGIRIAPLADERLKAMKTSEQLEEERQMGIRAAERILGREVKAVPVGNHVVEQTCHIAEVRDIVEYARVRGAPRAA